MTIDQFWAIVEETRDGFDPSLRDGNMDRQVQRFTESLGGLPPDEILQLARIFRERMNEAYRHDLWAAAYVIAGGCSDDWFMNFRSWLISMGRKAYEAAIRDPEALVDIADAPGVEDVFFEEFQHIPRQVYEERIGQEMADTGVEHPDSPAGEEWSEADLPGRLPKLWAKYGNR